MSDTLHVPFWVFRLGRVWIIAGLRNATGIPPTFSPPVNLVVSSISNLIPSPSIIWNAVFLNLILNTVRTYQTYETRCVPSGLENSILCVAFPSIFTSSSLAVIVTWNSSFNSTILSLIKVNDNDASDWL